MRKASEYITYREPQGTSYPMGLNTGASYFDGTGADERRRDGAGQAGTGRFRENLCLTDHVYVPGSHLTGRDGTERDGTE